MADALGVYETMKGEENPIRRWPSAHMLHNASVLMVDVLAEHTDCAADRAGLVAAIEAYEVARDGEES